MPKRLRLRDNPALQRRTGRAERSLWLPRGSAWDPAQPLIGPRYAARGESPMPPDEPPPIERADDEGRGRASYPWENLSPEAELAKERQISAMFPWRQMSPE